MLLIELDTPKTKADRSIPWGQAFGIEWDDLFFQACTETNCQMVVHATHPLLKAAITQWVSEWGENQIQNGADTHETREVYPMSDNLPQKIYVLKKGTQAWYRVYIPDDLDLANKQRDPEHVVDIDLFILPNRESLVSTFDRIRRVQKGLTEKLLLY